MTKLERLLSSAARMYPPGGEGPLADPQVLLTAARQVLTGEAAAA